MPDISVLNLDGTDRNVKDAGISSWARASTKPSYTASEVEAIASSLKGAANGVAELDSTGKVPSSQLPSYVDDVLEYASSSNFPSTGETGKIYIAKDTNKTYRWSGSAYVEISPSLALGETSSTAYRGDRGKTAYDHASAKGSAFSSGLYKITTNSEGHVTGATAVTKADITGLGIPGSDTNTHRPIQVNGTEILGNNTTALNLKAGSNVSVTNSSGTVTIAATDTKYTAATAAPGDITTGTASAGTSGNYARQDHTHKIATATTSVYGATKLNSATNSTSTSEAATPSAVKAAYDLAASKGTGTVNSVKCNGVTQTISSGAVNIDVATNLVTEAQWTQIQTLLS